ncbi:MAG: hypothetical protein ABIS17_04680 [Casimicrobiaceae bacterium]
MTRIIAGVFETFTEAARTREALVEAGFGAGDICSFFNNAPGQHAEIPTGGDETKDPEAQDAAKGAAGGAAVGAGVGLAVGLAAGPAALAIAGVGAYIGSLAGTGQATEDEDGPPHRRPAGVMVAVNVGDGARETDAVRVLHACGADNIERAQGQWVDGDWIDFNPIADPVLVEQTSLHAPGND